MKKFISLLVFLSFAIPSVGMEGESEHPSHTASPLPRHHDAGVDSHDSRPSFPLDLFNPSASSSHRAEPVESFVEEMPSSGMEAMRLLTRRLQQSLVMRHNVNISHYAKPLASLIMEGKLRTKSSRQVHYYSGYGVGSQFPQYGGRNITNIVEGKSYGMSRERRATPEEREDYYNALSTLVYTSIYAENYNLHDLSSFLENNIVIEGPELQEDKDNSRIVHRKIVFNYYDSMRRDGHHQGWERLRFLDPLIAQAIAASYESPEDYGNSAYAEVVYVNDKGALETIDNNMRWTPKLEEVKSEKEDFRSRSYSGIDLSLKQKMNEIFKKYFPYFSICSWDRFFEAPRSYYHEKVRGVGGLLLAYQEALSATVKENKEDHSATIHEPSFVHLYLNISNIGKSIEADKFFLANRGYIYRTLKHSAIIGTSPLGAGTEQGIMIHSPTNVFTAFADFDTFIKEIKAIASLHVSGKILLPDQQVIALNNVLNTFKELKGIDENEYGAAFKKRLDHDEDLTILTAMISEEAGLYQPAPSGSSLGLEEISKARLKGLGKKFTDKVSTLKKIAQSLPEKEEEISPDKIEEVGLLTRDLEFLKRAVGQFSFHYHH